jgi:hypothetical protein
LLSNDPHTGALRLISSVAPTLWARYLMIRRLKTAAAGVQIEHAVPVVDDLQLEGSSMTRSSIATREARPWWGASVSASCAMR